MRRLPCSGRRSPLLSETPERMTQGTQRPTCCLCPLAHDARHARAASRTLEHLMTRDQHGLSLIPTDGVTSLPLRERRSRHPRPLGRRGSARRPVRRSASPRRSVTQAGHGRSGLGQTGPVRLDPAISGAPLRPRRRVGNPIGTEKHRQRSCAATGVSSSWGLSAKQAPAPRRQRRLTVFGGQACITRHPVSTSV